MSRLTPRREPKRLSPAFYDTVRYAPRLVKDPEEDRGDWTVHLKGKGYARPAVPVTFLGTVVHEKDDPFATKAQQKKRRAQIEARVEKNAETLKKALFILSQSSTGRDVLEQMTKEGYRIVFDDRRTGSRGAGGLCDPADKTIVLRAHDNPEYLALLIGHESVHALQNARHDLFPSTRHRPEVGIMLSFAIEADAYAQQTQIALELSYGDPAGPQDQVRFAGPLQQMRERFPDIVAAAEKIMTHDAHLNNGKSVAAAFQAFYDNFYLRTFYEDAHIDWASLYAPQMKGKLPWLQKHFTKDVDSDWIKARIQHKGVAYLEVHTPNLDFKDARYSGVTEVTAKKIAGFYQKHLPKLAPALKKFGVHMKDAVTVVLGRSGQVHAVILPGDDTTKPPLRAPPPKKWNIFW